MPLQGNLKDFGFVEVLQLVSSQEKTGILRLNGDVGGEVLVFERGQIISAWDTRVTNRDPFREFLIRREIVPRESLARVLKAEIHSPHSFAEILLRMRVVSHGEIQDAFAEHIQERIDDLVLWKRGSFEFISQESVAPYAPGICLKAEGLLMEAVRRVDEGTGTKVRPETILARQDETAGAAGRGALSPTAERLLTMIDGSSTVGVLMREGGFARGEALAAAAELIEKEAVRVCTHEEIGGTAPVGPTPFGKIVAHTTALSLIILLSVFGFRWFAPRPDALWGGDAQGTVLARLADLASDRGLVTLRVGLELSRDRHGIYPARLESLVREGFLEPTALHSFSEKRLVYYTLDEGSGYRIEPRDAPHIVRRPKLTP